MKAVNYIHSKVLKHRQFLPFLADMESEHSDVMCYNSVCWLSMGRMLRSVGDRQKEILIFLEMKKFR